MNGPSQRRMRLGLVLITVGILAIVAGVLYVLEVADGPGMGPTDFAHRRSYNQTKEAVHTALPLGLAIAGSGLALAMLGGRLRRGPEPET